MRTARRLASLAACVAASAPLALAPGTAYAAEGTLALNGVHHQNPSGCYRAHGNLYVDNQTDKSVQIYRTSPDCHYHPTSLPLVHTPQVWRIPPHTHGYAVHVQSVYIP